MFGPFAPVAAAAFLMTAVASLVNAGCTHGWSSNELAAWAQAWGTVGALIAAVLAARVPAQVEAQRRENERRDFLAALEAAVDHMDRDGNDLTNRIEAEDFGILRFLAGGGPPASTLETLQAFMEVEILR